MHTLRAGSERLRITGGYGAEIQILIVVAEISERGDSLHRDARDLALGIERKGHKGGFERAVIDAREERNVLIGLKRSGHAGRYCVLPTN